MKVLKLSEENLEKWIKETKKSKEEIKKLKKKDRLETAASLVKLHNAISASLKGWAAWLTNPTVLDQLTEEELLETFKVFQKLALEFLDLDIKMTSAVLNRRKEKEKKQHRKKRRTKTGYIS